MRVSMLKSGGYPPIWKLMSSRPATHARSRSIPALITNEISPSVMTRMGSASSFTIGLTSVLMRPKTIEMTMSCHHWPARSNSSCGSSTTAAHKAAAVIAVRTMKSTMGPP